MSRLHRSRRRLVALSSAGLLLLGLAACGSDEERVSVGLITKQEDNSFWVTMRDIAEDTAADDNVELMTATGESDVDVDSQIAAVEQMTEDGVDGILIAPTDSEAVVPAIEKARDEGIIVIAVDTPTNPRSAVDALFATDNFRAGELIGQYARAKADEMGIEPSIAMLDLSPGIASGELRHDGFLEGFGLEEGDSQIVGSVDTAGDEDEGRAGMEELLASNPDVNIVYTVNEPAAFGAIDALKAEGVAMDDVIVVSVDGGCDAIKDGIRSGDIDATSQQYPENMAREGVQAIADAVRGGSKPSGYLDTGLRLITGDPVPGVEAEDEPFGVRNCWGD